MVRVASQPLPGSASQFPKPVAQVTTAQLPLEQEVVETCASRLQLVPQVPQFATVVFVFVSQPLVMSPSQLPYPPLQSMVQALAAQPATPLLLLQAWLHVPQCATVLVVFVSHPSPTLELQLPHPEEHVSWQALETHWRVATWYVLQAAPQAPQFSTSVPVETSHPSSTLLLQFA